MVYQLGVTWALGPDGNDKKFLLLLINLACVEVRMGLEDSTQVGNISYISDPLQQKVCKLRLLPFVTGLVYNIIQA